VKISAIRLKEVGRFAEPVALEGLSGGLDVLAGPNELGKSTILRAVKLALLAKHTSKTKEIEECRPYGGGAPLIEVDFEANGAAWRVRKQYLSGRAAELKNLGSGEIARGGDAEAQLERLMSETGRFALLWVGQGGSLEAVKPAALAGRSLTQAVEAEVETVADGGAAREVLALIKAELGDLVTGHTVPRPTGRYKAAMDARGRLTDACVEAQRRHEDAQARLDGLAGLRRQVAELAQPTAVAKRAEAAEAAARAFKEAAEAHQKLRQAQEAVVAHEARLAALKSSRESLEGKITDLAKLEEKDAEEAPRLAEAEKRVTDGEYQLQHCKERCAAAKSALAAAESERKALVVAARLREMEARMERAREAGRRIETLAADIEANGADDELMSAVRRQAQGIATLEARLSAAAPAVSVRYAKGADGRIRLAGRALADGEILNPRGPVALEIEGIGVITIAPGHGEGAEDGEADLARRTEKLDELLRRVPAANVEEAEGNARARRELLAARIEAQTELKGYAPQGLAALEREHENLVAQLPAGAVPRREQADLEALVQDLTADLAAAEAVLAKMQHEHGAVREAAATLRAHVDGRKARIAALSADLGDEAQWSARREKERSAVAECESALNAVVRDVAAWREKAPDDARLQQLRAGAEAAQAAKTSADRRLEELRRLEAGLEGQLSADRNNDVEARLAEIRDSLAVAEKRVAGIEDEIAAAQLLVAELEAAEDETRDRFAKPVIARLAPYLSRVFPDARARLGDGFALEALERDGIREELGRLSSGTQEQLAVLVRLGLGRLLAERGAQVPLILDDALVYSDDQRIERMFEALKLAAGQHQVIVLTCRERTFEGLGGTRVALKPWCPL
jgi:hypothetical protein